MENTLHDARLGGWSAAWRRQRGEATYVISSMNAVQRHWIGPPLKFVRSE